MIKVFKPVIILQLLFVSLYLFGQQNTEKRINDMIRWTEEYDGMNLKAGIDTLEYALDLSVTAGDIKLQAKVLMRLINYVTSRLNNFEKASEYVMQLGELSQKNPEIPELRSEYHNGLGCLFYYEGIDRKRAGAEFEKAIKIVRENGLTPGYSLLNNYALALQSNGRYEEAMDNFRLSQKSFGADTSEAKQARFILKSTLNIAICKINLGEHDSAEYYFRKVIEIAENTDVLDDDFQSYVYMGVFLHEHFRLDEALVYFYKSMPFIDYNSSYENKVYLFQSLADIYAEKKDYLKAHDFRKKELLYRDSLRSKKIMETALSMDYRFELDSLEHRKQFAEMQMYAEKEKYKVNLFAIISLLILIISVASFWLYRLQKQKQINAVKAENEAMEKEIIKKQAELDLLKKEEQLLSANVEKSVIENELGRLKNELQAHLDKSHDPQFDNLRHFLNKVKNSEKRSEQLKNLNNILKYSNSKFYNNFREKHPELTEDELRLITLIRLNLSSDDLIVYFNITKSSLNTKRYRIRKKLGLQKDDSLEEYIMKD